MGQVMDPGVQTASPSPGGSFRQALSQAARAIVAAGAAGPSPGGQFRQSLSPPTPVDPRFPYVMGLPDTGGTVPLPSVTGEGMPSLGSGNLLATGDLTPSTSGNPFTLGRLGDGFGSGGAGSSPGGQYRQAVEQGARALLGALTAPGGAGSSPGGQYRQALRRSARAVAAAKANLSASSLLFTGYDLPSRQDTATARLANNLGFGHYVTGREPIGWPPRGRGGAANAGPMMDAASRILAARSRSRNAAAAGAVRNSLMLGGSAGGRYDPSLMPQSPWAGVPPSLAADGYGPYRGLTTRRSRWLDFPRTKYPNSTLPEPGALFRDAVARLENPGFDTIQELYSARYGYDPDDNEGKGQPGVYQITEGEKRQIGAFDEGGNWNPDYYPGVSSREDYLGNRFAGGDAGLSTAPAEVRVGHRKLDQRS